jgi:small subunit ribosomal protein S1
MAETNPPTPDTTTPAEGAAASDKRAPRPPKGDGSGPKSGGRPPRPPRGGKPEAEPAIEVVARGKGKREGDPISVTTVSVEAVTVTEDVDFAALMAGDKGQGQSSGFEPGQRVKAIVEVISTTGPEIFLDLGGKATGYVLKEDVRDAEGRIVVKPGDEIEGIVYGQDDQGVRLRVRLGQEADMASVRAAFAAGIPVEGKVAGVNKGGYDVRLGNMRAFCPHSQIDVVRHENPEALIGQSFQFKITEIKDNASVVVSRAAILKEEAKAKGAELMEKIGVGMRLKGRVRSIQKFGVFVDLGGKDGLVHVSELSWNRVDDPHTVVKLGDEVDVVVTDINTETGKLGLSMKRAQEDPVEALGAKLQVGEITTGKVTRLKDFGAFVELADGVEGLIHISDLAHYRVRHPKDILKVGEVVSVKVLAIELDKRQIKLSLKALAADPWDGVADRYPVGKTVTGKIESVQEFGVFVALEPGVNALLPASESKSEGQPLAVAFKIGKDVEARILRVDVGEKRIALTRRDEEEVRSRPPRDDRGGPRKNTERMADLGIAPRGGADWNRRDDRRDGGGGRGRPSGPSLAYSDAPEKADKGKMGSLGELLMKALKKDK